MNKLEEVIIEAIQDAKAKDIVSIDMSQFEGAICQTFIVCSADSTTQVASICDRVEDDADEKAATKVWRIEGKTNGTWIVLDYGDTVVHIFQTETREYYKLDELWSDLPVAKYESFE